MSGSDEPAPAAEGEYTGKLYRGEHEGTVRGWLLHRGGCRLEFSGTKDHRRQGGYILIGRLTHMPLARQP